MNIKKQENLPKDYLRNILRSAILWSYDFEKFDFDRSYQVAIENVLSRGNWHEYLAVIRYYGTEKVIEAAKYSRILDPKSVNFASVFFNVPIIEFRNYKADKNTKDHWVF